LESAKKEEDTIYILYAGSHINIPPHFVNALYRSIAKFDNDFEIK
jgi:hypothetical protein